MGWIKRQKDEHVCNKPAHEDPREHVQPGDKWQCDECRAIWRVKSGSEGVALVSTPHGEWALLNWGLSRPAPVVSNTDPY